ncbi:Smr/MutS family protein [Aquimarina agarivorans]|uniref:Smr/MutS family protein n=1 Tax=Aquimarina agarivorans TaxID=980584 RepID=UPI000248EA19|nr:Smr/MutS family protein [Aquimarina agarivorans]
MMFIVGDYVMAIDDDVYGQVVRIADGQFIVLSTDGFEVAYARNELVLDKSKQEALDFSRNFSSFASENTSFTKRPKTTIQKKKEKQQPPMEVDLHIHKLVKNTKGMTNYDMMTIQLDTAKRQLDFAINKRIPRVVFIHGVGEGVLKAELEYMFQRYDNVRISDADYRKYGLGAMEVYILQNPRF